MNHDDMKESLTDIIMNNEEIIKLTEISKKEIIENIDKYLEEQEYEEMSEGEWYEYYLWSLQQWRWLCTRRNALHPKAWSRSNTNPQKPLGS